MQQRKLLQPDDFEVGMACTVLAGPYQQSAAVFAMTGDAARSLVEDRALHGRVLTIAAIDLPFVRLVPMDGVVGMTKPHVAGPFVLTPQTTGDTPTAVTVRVDDAVQLGRVSDAWIAACCPPGLVPDAPVHSDGAVRALLNKRE